MVFSDPVFLAAFLPLCLLAYWAGGWRARNLFLVMVGVVFYLAGGTSLILLLLGSIAVNYAGGALIARRRVGSRDISRLVCGIVVALNVALLAVWKYAGFAGNGIEALMRAFGRDVNIDLSLALPIAISFYTFQSISYVVDVAAGRTEPARNIVEYAACILLFPHLIAGPIVRFAEISDDLRRTPQRRGDDFAAGAPRFFWGLAKKVLIADQMAGIADAAFAVPAGESTTAVAWIAMLAYAVQIYFDFSGYTDMAVGLARMFGFRFPENFDRPYSAVSVTDFWRRWHMSLSSWFRDYVYIPLGGSRRGTIRTYANLWAVFLLTGLWHGAATTFVVWGLFHGALLVVERLTGNGLTATDGRRRAEVAFRRLVTFLLVCVGWLVFRAESIGDAAHLAIRLVSFDGMSIPPAVEQYVTVQRLIVFAAGIAVVSLPRQFHVGRILSSGEGRHATVGRLLVMTVAAPVSCVYVLSGMFSPFLYFQF